MTASIYATGLAGMQREMQGLMREAKAIAAPANGFEVGDVARSLVNAKQHQRVIEAQASVIARADRAIGHLIDELV